MKKKRLVLIQNCNRHAARAKVKEARRISATRTSCTLPAVQVFSAGGRTFCSRKRQLKLEKKGENGASQKEWRRRRGDSSNLRSLSASSTRQNAFACVGMCSVSSGTVWHMVLWDKIKQHNKVHYYLVGN